MKSSRGKADPRTPRTPVKSGKRDSLEKIRPRTTFKKLDTPVKWKKEQAQR